MFRPMRRKKKELSLETAKQLLTDSRRAVLSVNGDDGYPYAVPINYVYDADTNKIYFHGARAGHKYEAIKACDKVCFTVYGNETIHEDEPWAPFMQSAIAFGRCHLIEDQSTSLKLIKKMAMKYYPDEKSVDEEIAADGIAAQMYEIEIEHLTAKEIQEK